MLFSTNRKSHTAYTLAYTLVHSKGQDHAQCDCEYLTYGRDKANIANVNNQSRIVFQLAYLHLTWINVKGQDQGHEHLDCECLANGDRYGKHCYWHKIQSRMLAFE